MTIDPETGEVTDDVPTRRKRTPEERAEAERVRDERAAERRADLAILRSVDPACEVDSDPPIVWRVPVRMGGEPSGILLDVPRVSGRGKPGSRLLLVARTYDGCGPNGGEEHDYVSAFAAFRDAAGNARRMVGVAIHRAELREVAAALLAHADRLDGAGRE